MLHHVELYVSDLARSADFWGALLADLGYRPHQSWDRGRSWILGGTYVVLVQVEDRFSTPAYHRCRVGLNHVAFHASSREHVDRLTAKLRERGVKILYEDRHPHAGGQDSYAVFFEDPDRIKVELVAPASVRPSTGEGVAVREITSRKGAVCEEILRALPDWFGIEESVLDYIRAVESMPTWIAETGGETVGFLSLELKNEFVAEIHVMGVRREHHGRGCGTKLVEAAESHLRERRFELLVVKTLGPSRGDAGYARTRRFYLARGFRPIEEFHGVWSHGNPCLVMGKRVS
jgi:catechol 2,3-dioxygenase-like lactoylglutathione lyase family enzyme/GNAT superfamily N-acetyltransferase